VPRPSWLALLQKRANALAEVRAPVRRRQQVLAAPGATLGLNATDRLLGHPHRDRRVVAELARELLHPRFDPAGRHDLVDEPGRSSLLGREESRGEEEVLHPGRAERVQETRGGIHRDAVAEGSGDRRSEPRVGRRQPEIAHGHDLESAARGIALHLGDHRFRHPLEPVDPAIQIPLVLETVGGGAESGELADVGAGRECLPAGAAQHEHADGVVGVDLLTRPVESLVHGPRERVARFGTVERERDDRAVARHQHFVGHGASRGSRSRHRIMARDHRPRTSRGPSRRPSGDRRTGRPATRGRAQPSTTEATSAVMAARASRTWEGP
jgi:hypothetical protein